MTADGAFGIPSANNFKEGELLEVTSGPSSWVKFWESRMGRPNTIPGYLRKDIDIDSGIPIESKRKPVKVGTIVMYIGLPKQPGAKNSLVEVLYYEQVVAVMWECLVRAEK